MQLSQFADNERGYISTIFLSEKKDNTYHLVLNLKIFNRHVTYRHIQMDNLKTALYMVRKDCCMSSIDLSNAYYSYYSSCYLWSKVTNVSVFRTTVQVCLPYELTSLSRLFTIIEASICCPTQKRPWFYGLSYLTPYLVLNMVVFTFSITLSFPLKV